MGQRRRDESEKKRWARGEEMSQRRDGPEEVIDLDTIVFDTMQTT